MIIAFEKYISDDKVDHNMNSGFLIRKVKNEFSGIS